MEGLLHWDFNPGIAVADQVRRRFGETVHFSPSRSTKEFFLVVSFSSASFPLSKDSVSVALQCCIGGHPKGFKVVKLSDRSFRFSVAGNKVGHFIHGLRDRIWPDFICHFHLFNGRFNGYTHFYNQWHVDEHLEPIAARSPVAIRYSQPVFQDMSINPSSVQTLSKFDLVPMASMNFHDKNSKEASCSSSLPSCMIEPTRKEIFSVCINEGNQCASDISGLSEHSIVVGSFWFSNINDYPQLPQSFLASAFSYAPPRSSWPPILSDSHIADLSRAGYSHTEVSDIAKNWGQLCGKCLQWGHNRPFCHARLICLTC